MMTMIYPIWLKERILRVKLSKKHMPYLVRRSRDVCKVFKNVDESHSHWFQASY